MFVAKIFTQICSKDILRKVGSKMQPCTITFLSPSKKEAMYFLGNHLFCSESTAVTNQGADTNSRCGNTPERVHIRYNTKDNKEPKLEP